MKNNMSTVDRIIGVIIALIITILTYYKLIPGVLGIVALYSGWYFVVTTFINCCPLYTIVGIRKWESRSMATKRNQF